MNKKCPHGRVKSTCSTCSPQTVYNQYRYKAEKQRGLMFDLTLEQFEHIVALPCVFCTEQNEPRGIDRKNNDVGYVWANCQACCGPCNRVKGSMEQGEWLAQVDKIAKHQEVLRKRKQQERQIQTEQEPAEEPEAVVPPRPTIFIDQHFHPDAKRFLDTGAR
jgi:5-methylcytosine-specific restriction endonuclease McrA